MAIIDKGEKHLFIRRLLQSDDSVIAWGNVVDITFELSFLGEETVETWSKVIGGVTQSGDSVRFELDSGSIDKGTYYLKATLVVNDETWNNGTSDDITWETEKIQVIETPTPTNPSSSTGDLKFDVSVVPDVDPPANPPTQGAFATSQTTATTANLPYTQVDGATFYEYELESGGGAVNNGSKLRVELTELNPDSTDRWRVRAGNSADVSAWSPYQSFTTNPSVAPAVDGAITTDTNSASFTLVDEGLEVEYFRDGSWQSFGVTINISIPNLAENTEIPFPFRYINAGGRALDANGDPVTTTITVTTQQAAPSTAPTITEQSVTDTTATFSRTSVAGADDYEASINSGAYTSVGLLSTYTLTGRPTNTTFTHVLQATNDGGDGPDSNELTTLTLPGAITLQFVEASDTSITYNVVAGAGTGSLTYAVSVDGGAYETVTVGENTKTGLANPETSYAFTVRATNASGTGAEATFNFSTTASIAEPTWTTANFTNTLDSISLEYSGGGPNYDIRFREVGGSYGSVIDNGTNTSYTLSGTPSTQYDVDVRSNDGTTQSAWVTERVQTDGFTPQETSETGQFTTIA